MSDQDDFGNAPEDSDFDTDLDADFEEFDQEKTLGDLWKNPIVKMGTVLGGFLVVVGSIMLFGGGETPEKSRVTGTPDMKETPGTTQVSKSYEEAVREKDRAVIREAERQGESAMPTPIDPVEEDEGGDCDCAPGGTNLQAAQQNNNLDPLERWRQLQQERAKQESQQQQEDTQNRQQPNRPLQQQKRAKQLQQRRQARAKAVNNLAKSMAEQMQGIMSKQRISGMRKTSVASFKAASPAGQQAGEQTDQGQGSQQQQGSQAETLLQAGTIEFAQLLIEANSDTGGPILAEIASGPFKGARLIGSFDTKQERYITMNFDTMSYEDEIYRIDAIALDPDTTLSGMATEVDRRYFRRIILPAAAKFLEGFGEGVAQAGSTTTNTDNASTVQQEEDLDTQQELARGAEEAFSEFGDLLDEEARNIDPLIRVAAGTPIGIFFTSSVTSQSVSNGSGATTPEAVLQQRRQGNADQQSFTQRAGERLRETAGEQIEETGDNALNQIDFLQQLQNQ